MKLIEHLFVGIAIVILFPVVLLFRYVLCPHKWVVVDETIIACRCKWCGSTCDAYNWYGP